VTPPELVRGSVLELVSRAVFRLQLQLVWECQGAVRLFRRGNPAGQQDPLAGYPHPPRRPKHLY